MSVKLELKLIGLAYSVLIIWGITYGLYAVAASIAFFGLMLAIANVCGILEQIRGGKDETHKIRR